MEKLKKWWKSSSSLQNPAIQELRDDKIYAATHMVLPTVEQNFLVAHSGNEPQHVSYEDWKKADTNGMLLNFPSRKYAAGHVKALDKLGTHYIEQTHIDPKTKKEEWQRSFAICENPQHKGEIHLYEIPYQYFDSDKDVALDTDSTGFKMSAVIEHVLNPPTKDTAQKTIDYLKTMEGVKTRPDGSPVRNLVKDKDGKVIVNLSLGGWTWEVGGGYNAREIENGGIPLQWKNLLGIDGKPRALDDALASLQKIGVELHPQNGKPGATIEIAGDSMGTPNAQMVKFLLETQYGQKHVPLMNMVPMAQMQVLKQLTELAYNLKHKGEHYVHLNEKEMNPAQQAEAIKIGYAIHDSDNLKTVFASNNYFAYFNVNGNSTINNAPGLPGDSMLLLKPDEPTKGPLRDTYFDHGFRIKSDHLLPGFNKKMMEGAAELTQAYFIGQHTLQDYFFGNLKEAKGTVENQLIESFHAENITMQQAKYHIVFGNKDGSTNQQPRKPIKPDELLKAVENYSHGKPTQDITVQLTPVEAGTLRYLQSEKSKPTAGASR